MRDNVALLAGLSDAEQTKLRSAIQILMAEKYWEGCGGLRITDEIRVTIAALAGLMLLGWDDYYFDEVRTVLVYAGGYLSAKESSADYRLGEAHRRGPVVVSWWHACWSGRRRSPTNVVIHEFAHKLAELGDPERGMPPITDLDLADRWVEVMEGSYRQLRQDVADDLGTVLDPYGATNRAEFFAVATESFFLSPRHLQQYHPETYNLLAAWYRQDPAKRSAWGPADQERCDRANREYYQHIVDECTEAVRLVPDFVEAYQHRAGALESLGEAERALLDRAEVIRLSANDADAYCERGETYMKLGRFKDAAEDYTRAIQRCPDYAAPPYFERGAALTYAGELDDALADFTRAIQDDLKADAAFLYRGYIYFEKGELERALADFDQAIQLWPSAAEAYWRRARVHIARRAFDLAVKDCTEAIRLDPDETDYYHARAEAYAALRQEDRADQDRAMASGASRGKSLGCVRNGNSGPVTPREARDRA